MTNKVLSAAVQPGLMLQGKVIAITGGAGGIGGATARVMAAEGAAIVVNDLPGRAQPVVSALIDAGFRAVAAEGDITKEVDVEAIVKAAVSNFGRLDGMMNNATSSDSDDGDVANMSLDVWEKKQAICLRAPMFGCKHAVRQFLAQGSGGSIINVSSTSAYQGDYRFTSYAAGKAGVLQLTRSVATQYGKVGIRCNTILPGSIVTPSQASAMGGGKVLLDTRLTPRLGDPHDIAHLAAFLMSDRSEYITGQDIRVDGGGSAHQPWVPHLTPPPV